MWRRQLRWARLRRLSFPGSFCAELPAGGVFPFLLAGWLAAEGILPWAGVVAMALAWYGAEALLARAFGWPLRVRSPLFWVARDLLLPVLWTRAWAVKDYEWRGTRSTSARPAPAPDAPSAMRLHAAALRPAQAGLTHAPPRLTARQTRDEPSTAAADPTRGPG